MTKKIFFAIFITSMLTLILANILLLFVLKSSLQNQAFIALKNQANTLEPLIPLILEKKITLNIPYRFSIIDKNGEVLYDSKENDLPNHKDRQEIKDAMIYGVGQSVRYSNTLDDDMLYFALKSTQNPNLFLRLSQSASNVSAIFLEFVYYFLLELLFAGFVCYFIARFLTDSIIKPLRKFDTSNTKQNPPYKELLPFVEMIKHKHKLLKTQLQGLKKKQAQMLVLTQNMHDGLMLLNKNGKILLCNTYMNHYCGDSEHISNLNNPFLCLKKDLAIYKKNKKQAQNTHQITLEDKEHELQVAPVYSKGKFRGLIVILRDISALYLAQKMRKEFSVNVTHELKTPLTSILASAEMLQNDLIEHSDIPEFASKITQEATRLLEMINEVLKLSLLDEAQVLEPFSTFDLEPLVRAILVRLEVLAKKHSININSELSSCYVRGDRKLLEDCIYNLCNNAIKYNKPNGSVRVRLYKNAQNVILSVKDTGIGIPKDSQKRVFERFYCVDKSRSKALGGTGLGLSIVKSIAKVHNATLSLKSTENKGSEFSLKFEGV